MSGVLGKFDLGAGQDTVVYQVPMGKTASLILSLCNRSASNALVSVALSSNGATAPSLADYIEFESSLGSKSVLERTGIVLGLGQILFVRSSVAGVSAVVYGFEE